MSRVFNVPERELTHKAFTDLKHEANQKKMTMYQVSENFKKTFVVSLNSGKREELLIVWSSEKGEVSRVGETVSLKSLYRLTLSSWQKQFETRNVAVVVLGFEIIFLHVGTASTMQ